MICNGGMFVIFEQTADTLFVVGECVDGSEMVCYVFGDDINYFCLACEHNIIDHTCTAHS